METAKLKRPVLVGWSYGGDVIGDYLRVRGVGSLAGLNFVDTVINSDPSHFGDGLKVQPLMFSEDLATNIAATRQFLHKFTQKPNHDRERLLITLGDGLRDSGWIARRSSSS
jgi:non-heme chloroperoxidase